VATKGALAALPQSAPDPAAQTVAPRPPAKAPTPRQVPLFQERATGKIIPFVPPGSPAAAPVPEPQPKKPRAPARRTPPVNDAQPSLDFLPSAPPSARKLSTTVEAVIYCDAPVAAPMHRALAAVLDGGMIVIGLGVFLSVFHWMGGALSINKLSLMMYGAAALIIALFYSALWAWAGGLSFGMRAASLTLISFDGYPPERGARWLRYLGGCLSYFACGLGILWALVDEESLSWQDHISKTFPTIHGSETNFVRQR